MKPVESLLEELRTIEQERHDEDAGTYAEIVAAQARSQAWRVTVKAFGQVLNRLGRKVEDFERDAGIVRQSDNLASQARSAKAARDSAVAELEARDAEHRELRQRLATIEGRQQELRSISSAHVWAKSAYDKHHAQHAELLNRIHALEGGNHV